MTPYKLAKLINAALVEAGLPTIRPQMLYNYARNGLIKVDGESILTAANRVDEKRADEFVATFVARRQARAASTEEVSA